MNYIATQRRKITEAVRNQLNPGSSQRQSFNPLNRNNLVRIEFEELTVCSEFSGTTISLFVDSPL